MIEVLAFLTRAGALLEALIAGGIVRTSSGTEIAGILAAVTGVIQGAQNPTPALVGQVMTLLSELKVDNVISGSFVDTLTAGLTKFASFVSDVKSEQVAIIKDGPLFGVPGAYAYIPSNSPQGVSLGMGSVAP